MAVRVCCGSEHDGSTCPDGRVMCCLCFGRFMKHELYTDIDGDTWDICDPCARQGIHGPQ